MVYRGHSTQPWGHGLLSGEDSDGREKDDILMGAPLGHLK